MTKKARADAKGKAEAAARLHALSKTGAFDFINNMLGVTVETISRRLGIEPPDNWRDPVKESGAEDFARWLEQVPPTFDLDADPLEIHPRELYDERGVQRNPLTSAEAEHITRELSSHLREYPELGGAFLLLLYALANEHGEDRRSEIYYAACERLAPVLDGISEAIQRDHLARLVELRKGGE